MSIGLRSFLFLAQIMRAVTYGEWTRRNTYFDGVEVDFVLCGFNWRRAMLAPASRTRRTRPVAMFPFFPRSLSLPPRHSGCHSHPAVACATVDACAITTRYHPAPSYFG
ncbi:hypothetical protein GY45DRAFT_494171 [Cubamyces sp. BRFM 1775]|nr:hypothetical protein GY45DRAFT_494171 [Cubamyces sp. BRFM 1775]